MRANLLQGVPIEKTISFGNSILKIALLVSIISLTVSIILSLWFSDVSKGLYTWWYTAFTWYSFLASMWVLVFSPLYLLIVASYGQLSANRNLKPLTSEFILLLVNIFIAGIFVMTALEIDRIAPPAIMGGL